MFLTMISLDRMLEKNGNTAKVTEVGFFPTCDKNQVGKNFFQDRVMNGSDCSSISSSCFIRRRRNKFKGSKFKEDSVVIVTTVMDYGLYLLLFAFICRFLLFAC